MASGPGVTIRRLATDELEPLELDRIRALVRAAFADDGEGFGEDDWAHALGGVHVVLAVDGRIASHGSVVERELHVGDRALRTGYVEAVATDERDRRRGLGSLVMTEIAAVIGERFELGALSTGEHRFYERLGWLRWRGPTFVRTPAGSARTADEDDGIMVLPVPGTGPLERSLPISCDWRSGDVW
jgi:aminoglycoside 2'-N-acetyltransferase I